MEEFKRADRVADQIRMEIADLLIKGAKDPRFQWVSVTAVEVSDDLRQARVFVAIIGQQDNKKILLGLKRASGFIRAELSRRLPLRRVPEIIFFTDTGSGKVSDLLMLMDQIKH